jgi:hypothetical protein
MRRRHRRRPSQNTIEVINPPDAKRGGQDRNRRCAVGDKYQRITSQAATGTEASMNKVTMGFSLISVPPLFDLAAHVAPSMPAEPDPGIPIDPMSVAGDEP